MTAPPDHPPIRCVLELRYDGTLAITRLPGCTISDVHDILRLPTQSPGPFDYIAILPEGEDVGGRERPHRGFASGDVGAREPRSQDDMAVEASGADARIGGVIVGANADITLQ